MDLEAELTRNVEMFARVSADLATMIADAIKA